MPVQELGLYSRWVQIVPCLLEFYYVWKYPESRQVLVFEYMIHRQQTKFYLIFVDVRAVF